MNAYPEHEKLEAIADKSQACGEFMEWLTAQGIVLAKYHFHTDECHEEGKRWPVCGMSDEMLYPTYTNLTDLLARHFGIDQNKIEAEKRAILAELRTPAPTALSVPAEPDHGQGVVSMAAERGADQVASSLST